MSIPSSVLKVIEVEPALLVACFVLVLCLAYSFTLNMEATYFSNTSVDLQRATRRYTG
jgi:hypothetical protein